MWCQGPSHCFRTLILRGADLATLAVVKRVLRHSLHVLQCMRLEALYAYLPLTLLPLLCINSLGCRYMSANRADLEFDSCTVHNAPASLFFSSDSFLLPSKTKRIETGESAAGETERPAADVAVLLSTSPAIACIVKPSMMTHVAAAALGGEGGVGIGKFKRFDNLARMWALPSISAPPPPPSGDLLLDDEGEGGGQGEWMFAEEFTCM